MNRTKGTNGTKVKVSVTLDQEEGIVREAVVRQIGQRGITPLPQVIDSYIYHSGIDAIKERMQEMAKTEMAWTPVMESQGLPDSDLTVLIRIADDEWPVMVGFHDGEVWREASSDEIESPVSGWMHLHRAAEILDGPVKGGGK